MSVVGALFCTAPSLPATCEEAQHVVHVGGIVQEHLGVEDDVAAPALIGLGGDAAAVEGDRVDAIDRDIAAVASVVAKDRGTDFTAVQQLEMVGVDENVAAGGAE